MKMSLRLVMKFFTFAANLRNENLGEKLMTSFYNPQHM